KLELPGAENRSRTPKRRIGRVDHAIFVMPRRRADKVRRAVDAEYLVDVGPVEEIECFGEQMEPQPLLELEVPGQAKVHGYQLVSQIRIPGGQSNPVGYRIGVVVDIEASKYCERPPGLRPDDAAQLKVTQDGLIGSRCYKVGDEPVADVLV